MVANREDYAYMSRVGLRLDEYDISDWNDAPGRTAAEVAHLLRGAALEGLWPGEEGKT